MRSAPIAAAALATLTVLAALAGCSSAHHSISTSAGAPRSAPASQAASPAEAPSAATAPTVAVTGTAAGVPGASPAAGGSAAAAAAAAHRGSVAVAESKPVLTHGTATASVTCENASPVYVALVSKAQVGSYTHSFTVRVTGYHGPGRYQGTLSGTVIGPRGTVAALTGVTDPAVTLTGTGGTFVISTTGSGDHSLDATVSWACP